MIQPETAVRHGARAQLLVFRVARSCDVFILDWILKLVTCKTRRKKDCLGCVFVVKQ
jgi:hypothetical protein